MEGFPKKRQYMPESETLSDDELVAQMCSQQYSQAYDDWEPNQDQAEIETQCDDDDDEFVEDTCFQQELCEPKEKYKADGALPEAKKPKIATQDNSTCTEKMVEREDQVPKVLDIHGCKFFGELVSNELLRFDIDKRYEIMQKILGIFKTK